LFKNSNFDKFGNGAIRHIQMAIRHMWRVANGLDNSGLDQRFSIIVEPKTRSQSYQTFFSLLMNIFQFLLLGLFIELSLQFIPFIRNAQA